MTKVAAIETKGLCIGYLLKGGKRKVVHEDLNLQLVSGEVTCLLGLNGAGKSTLLRTLCGFQLPLGGEIRLMGKPLSGYSQANFSLTVGVVLTDGAVGGEEACHRKRLMREELPSMNWFRWAGILIPAFSDS